MHLKKPLSKDNAHDSQIPLPHAAFPLGDLLLLFFPPFLLLGTHELPYMMQSSAKGSLMSFPINLPISTNY